jgi:hypothetical protein
MSKHKVQTNIFSVKTKSRYRAKTIMFDKKKQNITNMVLKLADKQLLLLYIMKSLAA